jgi:hypothetical protein
MSTKIRYTNPFPGLRSFESQDSELFFGRESHIKESRSKLAQTHFLAIVASSGSGKSSMIKAGLIPSIQREKLNGTTREGWNILLFRPGANPIWNFAKILHKSLYGADNGYEDTARKIAENPEYTFELLQKISDKNILIVIDQFEEVFRYTTDGDKEFDESSQLINLIIEFSRQVQYPVYVVLTMRSDYLDYCTNYEGFTEVINQGYYLLSKMNREEIKRAILKPVELKGAGMTPELTDRLLHEVESSYDHLPILQHALMRTWNFWESHDSTNPLEISHYEAIGTMKEAVSRHAEEIFHDLPGERSRLAIEKLFKSLIELDLGDIGVIRPARLKKILRATGVSEDMMIDVIDRFRQQGASFLTPSFTQKIDENSFVDISLEKIMTLWGRLKDWVGEETDSAKLYKKLAVSAKLNQAGKTGLLVNPELQTAVKWLKENQPTREWAEKYDPYFERVVNYIDSSRNEYEESIRNNEKKQQRELKRARYFATVMGLASLMSLLFLVVSIVMRSDAEQSRNQSLEKEKIALAERSRAEAQTKESFSQKRIAEQQEKIAEQQRRLTEEQRSIAVREQQLAELKRREAEIAQRVAVNEKMKANSAQKMAEQQKNLAVQAKSIADQMRFQAEESRKEAVVSQKDAEQQRGKAISRSMAIQSYQMAGTAQDGLPAILAAQAYRLNIRNGGEPDNPDIFKALTKATEVRNVQYLHNDMVRSVITKPGGDAFASIGDDGKVRVWGNKQPIQTYATNAKGMSSLRSLVFTPDGNSLVAGSADGTLYVWNTLLPSALPKVIKAHNGVINGMFTNPKVSDQLITISGNGNIRTWKMTQTGLDSLQNIKSSEDIFCTKLTPDGKYLASGSSKGRVLIFEIAALAKEPVVYNYNGFGARVTALAFDPEGNYLITANSAGALYRWNFTDNKIDRIGSPLSGRHTSTVNDVIFSPDGKLMATCSYDWSVHLWNYQNITNRQIQPIVIDDYDSWVLGIIFSKDGKELVACGADRTIRTWNVNPEGLYQQVLDKVDRDLTVEEWNRFVGKDIPYEKTVRKVVN